MGNKVKLENLTKSFKGEVLLSNLYFEVGTKDIIGIFGRNGVGKSSLLKILFGTLSADQIFMTYNNQPIRKTNKFKNIFSLSTQDVFLPSNLSVEKAISLLVEQERQTYLFEDTYLKKHLKHSISELSSGLASYVQTKCILYNKKPFCLFDEPFAGLSPILCEALKQDFLFQSQHKGIVIVEHKHKDTLDISNKNYMLKNASMYIQEGVSK